MRIGLALPQYDFSVPGESPLTWETLRGFARRADEVGFDSLWLSDHLFFDVGKYGGSSEPAGAYEPIVTLAALAREVKRARLGTLVLCEALRPATVLAKALASLDRITGGRLDVGLGAGWYEPEYAAIGMDFPSPAVRLARLAEAVEIVVELLGPDGGPCTFDGRFHRADGAQPPARGAAAAAAGVRRRQGRPAHPARGRPGRRLEHVLGVDAGGVPGAPRRARRRLRPGRARPGDGLALARALRAVRRGRSRPGAPLRAAAREHPAGRARPR